MIKPAALLACSILLLCACSHDRGSGYAPVKSDVSYTSVTELAYAGPDAKLAYGTADPDLQYGLLWVPAGTTAAATAPLVVLIHGGCWLNQYDIEHSNALSAALAGAGYAVWSLEYRRTGDPGGGWPGSFEDIKQGLAYVSSLGDYPLDLTRVVIAGHSAGGHLALLAGAETRHVAAVIGLAAITDIVEYSRGENSCQTAAVDFMGGAYEANPAAYAAANPVHKPLHRNTLLLHGNEDRIVPPAQAQASGATTLRLEGAGHFDWIHPGTRAYRLLLSTLEDVFQR